MSSASSLRRLEQLEKAIKLKQPRQITILVDGNAEDQLSADTVEVELAAEPYQEEQLSH